MYPVLFNLPLPFLDHPYPVQSYGVCLLAAFALAFALGHGRGIARGIDQDHLLNFYILIFVSGMGGARLTYILTEWHNVMQRPAEYLLTFKGGGVLYGGLIGAIGSCWLFLRYHRENYAMFADEAPQCMILGQAVGRLGCFLTGCCHGLPWDGPWACTFSGVVGARHPTQLYELLGDLAILAITWRMVRRPHRAWSVAFSYLVLYGGLRFVIEMVRGDNRGASPLPGLSVSQSIALPWIAIGLIGLWATRNGPIYTGETPRWREG